MDVPVTYWTSATKLVFASSTERFHHACMKYAAKPLCSSLNSEFQGSIWDNTQAESSVITDFPANLRKFLISQQRYGEGVKFLFILFALPLSEGTSAVINCRRRCGQVSCGVRYSLEVFVFGFLKYSLFLVRITCLSLLRRFAHSSLF